MYGMLAACIVFFGGASLYGIAKYGSPAKAIGNLWGMLVIFWGILSAFVSAGIALLFYAWRGPAGAAGAGPAKGPWSSPPSIT
jgi:formate hydrogenlyase subunit 3/multisubunit Na+/H+ antiporter MnhD subunit